MTLQVDTRLSSIESRLSVIENRLGISQNPSQAETKNINNLWPAFPEKKLNDQNIVEHQDKEKSGNWLGIVAVICFILAAGFIIKLSIDTGWLTQTRQIGIATFFGFSLIIAGFFLKNSDREYASLLPAAGIIVLYIVAFASHRYYSLITFEHSLSLTFIISSFCIYLYTGIRHDIYIITASVGAYIAPVILELNASSVFSLYYFIICSFTFSAVSILLKSRLLTIISAYLAILMTSLIGLNINQNTVVAYVLPIHFLIFSMGTYIHSLKTKTLLTEDESWSFFPVLLIFYVAEYHYINKINMSIAPYISLAFAALIIGLYLLARKEFSKQTLNSQSMIFCYLTIICFHSVYLEILPTDFRPWLFIIILLSYTIIPFKLPVQYSKNSPSTIPIVAIILILIIEYLNIIFRLMTTSENSWITLSLSVVGSIWVLLLFSGEEKISKEKHSLALLSVAHIMAIASFYRIFEDNNSLAVSASWLIYAVAVMVLARIKMDKVMAKSAIFVLGFAAAKALLYDAASAPTVIRIFCLLLTGAVLYSSGFFMRKIGEWKKQV